jgi:NADP-dependent 3-hydroxy acid dehydrogenase YdfG
MNSFLNLKNKTILVTGASSGIGKEIAIQLDKCDANIVLTGRNKERLYETRDELSYHFGVPSEAYICDLSKEEEIIKLVNNLPILLKPCSNYTPTDGYDYQDPLSEVYKSILVDLVVESHVAGCTFFPTEKTVRPMLMKKPFVVFGYRSSFH